MSDEKSEIFDLCILGCGPGGFAAAMRALDLGRNVCIIESGEIGGAGVKWGALASKTMWELAKDYDIAAKTDRGYRASGLSVDYQDLRRTVLQAVKEKQFQMLSQLETYSRRHWKGPGALTFKRGRASFEAPGRVGIAGEDGRRETVRAGNVLIATGSTPRHFPGIPVDQRQILDSDGVLNLEEFPRRLVIIGAGIIGCEYAAIFSNFRRTKVYLVDHKERIVPFEDEDVSDFVSQNLKKNGVEIFHSANLQEIRKRPDHLEVVLGFADGYAKVVEADTVLFSIGRQPNLWDLNLAATGVMPSSGGFLDVDENCRVAEGIYAVGDVTRHPALVNLAEMESRHAVKSMFGRPDQPLNYANMSTVMFFKPAVAAVGLNEQACRRRGIPHRVAYYANSLLSRAIAMRAADGFVKIIATDEEHPRILGLRSAGPQVSSTIMSIALLMDQERRIGDVLQSVYPHPTMSEGIQECLRLLVDKSVYKCRAFPEHLRIWTWAPPGRNDGTSETPPATPAPERKGEPHP